MAFVLTVSVDCLTPRNPLHHQYLEIEQAKRPCTAYSTLLRLPHFCHHALFRRLQIIWRSVATFPVICSVWRAATHHYLGGSFAIHRKKSGAQGELGVENCWVLLDTWVVYLLGTHVVDTDGRRRTCSAFRRAGNADRTCLAMGNRYLNRKWLCSRLINASSFALAPVVA